MKKIFAIVMVLAMVAAVVVPLSAVAAGPVNSDSGSTTISGSVPVVISVSAPSSASLGTMVIGNNSQTGGPITVTVSCTQPAWILGVKDASGNGHMLPTSGPALTNALQIKGGDQGTYTNLSASDVSLETTGAAAAGVTNISDVNFQQAVVYGDHAGSYSIILTFTATATP